jgi:hypothetical protein
MKIVNPPSTSPEHPRVEANHSRNDLPSHGGRWKTSLESRSTSAAGHLSQGGGSRPTSHDSKGSAERDLIKELEEQRRINSGLVRRNVALMSQLDSVMSE